MEKYLLDRVGRKYPRKNEYLKELIELEQKGERNVVQELKSCRDNHPYIVQLNRAKEEEKVFLQGLKTDTTTSPSDAKELQKMNREIDINEKKRDFYEKYKDLEYDFTYEYLIAKTKAEEIGWIRNEYIRIQNEIEQTKDKLKNIDPIKEKEALEKIERESKRLEEVKDRELSVLKQKLDEKILSKKGYRNEKAEVLRRTKDQKNALQYQSDKTNLEAKLKALYHEQKRGIENKKSVLKDNLSTIRRTTPIELEKEKPLRTIATLPFPGVGQLLNKQYIKGLLFLLMSLFIYLFAIPYALGYGNYQGEGIRGLFTLAEGGLRVHKSLIFMIEGIVAIFLVLIGLFFIFISYRDARKVEKDELKGIRVSDWYETRTSILRDGFPYVVNTPALLLIVFIVFVPIVTTFLLSFTGMNPTNQSKFPWVGIDNYRMIALGEGLAGSVFWKILLWTVIWTFASSTLAILIGFILALLANNERIKGKTFFRTVYILPWAVPAFITIMFFSIMVSPNGILTELIHKITGQTMFIKNNTIMTRMSVILLQGWLGSSYIFLLTTGVLQAIPGDLYEAAKIDGATALQSTMRITVPLVLFQISPLLVTQYTFNFNNFSIIYLFNQGGPFNPTEYGNLAGSSDILISYIYKLTMENQYQAIGAAITMLIALALMFFTYLGFRNAATFKEG